MKRRACILVGPLLIIIAGTALPQTSATGSSKIKRRISDQEFLDLFKHGKIVTDRTISSSAIEAAITYATKIVSQKGQTRNTPQDTKDASAEAKTEETDLEDPAGDETQPQSDAQELSIMVSDSIVEGEVSFRHEIPISLSFQKTLFKNEVSSYDAIFKEPISFYRSTFQQEVHFSSATFQDLAHFVGAKFESNAWFSETNFNGRVSFAYSTAGAYLSFYGSTFHQGANFASGTFKGPVFFSKAIIYDIKPTFEDFAKHTDFDETKFEEVLDFSEARIYGKITFYHSAFHNDVFFIDLNKQSDINMDESVLEFSNVSFAGRLYFTNATVTSLFFFKIQAGDQLYTSDDAAKSAPSRESLSPIDFEKRAIFSGLQCNNADFTEVEFRDYVDFSRAHFFKSANFSNATFEGDVNFGETEFPSTPNSSSTADKNGSGLVLDNVRFQKNVDIEWLQLDSKVNTNGSETWRRLEDVFKKKANLEGQNESMYQRLLLEGLTKRGWPKFLNWLERWFWGYGVRPLRLLIWTILLFVFFTAIYWKQTKALEIGRGGLRNKWNRLIFSLGFSLRTSWTVGYGYTNSRTTLFKIITLIHSIAFKVMLICLLKVFSNTSPLLNELVGKLVRL